MAKLIAKYEPAVLVSVEKRSKSRDLNWDWRKGLIGEPGCLFIYESEMKEPGKQFAYMCCYDYDYLVTTCGETELYEDRLILTTRNSRYVFDIGKELKLWQEKEKPEMGLSD
ncbi:MAG: hypothetical protein IKI49_05400 [Oscillospiraceae bacterium]|nr:hypothetical protein [Oscillospiraceae bacterium]